VAIVAREAGAGNAGEREAALPVGLIGLGKHGERYLTHIRRDATGLRIAALCRRDEDAGRAIAAEVGARFHPRAADLIADPEVRAVIAVVPPSAHGEIVEGAARERKPLLIEKPFAMTAEEGFRLRDLLAEQRVPCLVAHTLRFGDVVRMAHARLEEIGTLSQMVLGQSFEPTRLGWLDDLGLSGGGNILHTGVHMFDLLRHFSGMEADEVVCLIDRVVTRATEDSFAASISLAAPGTQRVLAAVSGSRATQSRYGEIRLIGDRGQIVADHVHCRLALIVDRRETPLGEPRDVPTVLVLLQEFRRVAEGAMEPSVTAADGAAAVAIADACYRSAESGRRVTVRS
jgi:predicted dehydrogenase